LTAPLYETSTAITIPTAHTRNNELEQDVIHLFCDGACSGNPGHAGCGVVLVYNGRKKEFSEYIGRATNNIAELTSLKIGLEAITHREKPLRIYADSEYVIGVLTRDWKPKANLALIDILNRLIAQFPDISFLKVKGHAGITLNERADALARAAIKPYKD
jgi:ribonuclease HI